MNSELFYKKKYLKYKAKYLQEKNKIEGGGIFSKRCEPGLLSELQTKINPLQYLPSLLDLVKNGALDVIITLVKSIYMNTVLLLLKYNKDCLAPQLNRYLSSKQDELCKHAVLEFPVKKSEEFPKLTITSLNIKEQINNGGTVEFIPEITDDCNFSKGTAFISSFVRRGSTEEFRRNLRYLTNLLNIRFSINSSIFIESLRFGTPYAPSGSVNFYETQITIIKKYVGNKKCVIISFLDPCDSALCFVTEKSEEDKIIRKEITGYASDNFAYLNMSCNNGVNLKRNISSISDTALKLLISQHIDKLEKWITDADLDCEIQEILNKLKNNDGFFQKLRKYVADKDNLDPKLLEQLKIRKFVLRKKPKEQTQLLNFNDNMKQFSPCEEDLTNEHIGLVMFCYVSLIFYILSKSKPSEFILLYHCKSGQDRTGTFFAINQMVNQITTEHYVDIVKKILSGTSFVDIFFEYYSLTKKIIPIPPELKFCPDDPSRILHENTRDDKINKEVELCYLRYLSFSYMITLTSTGIPGIKWGLTKTSLAMRPFNRRKYDTGGAIDNRYGFLLLK